MNKFKSVDIPGLIKKSEKELAEAGLSENEIFGSPQFREYLQHLADGITAQFNKNKPYLELVSEDPKRLPLQTASISVSIGTAVLLRGGPQRRRSSHLMLAWLCMSVRTSTSWTLSWITS